LCCKMSNHIATCTNIWNSGLMLVTWNLNTETGKQLTQYVNWGEGDKEVILYLNNLI
jgi:hypothetical protein